ncbi:MAG: N-acyl-D-amino-acid deacylase family protein [Dehalococcoidia bacterium]
MVSESEGSAQTFDLIIRGGMVYDGSGEPGRVVDVAVNGDQIALIGSTDAANGATVIDATGLAVAPGFINMLSHSYHSILQDPRSLSELVQGVTTQIFGEGYSMGPLTPDMQEQMRRDQSDLPFDVSWTSLAGYLQYAEKKGISQNIASYIGATTLRVYTIGHDNRPATSRELDQMRGIVADEMSAGALGIGSSLIYPPAFFASTEELIEQCTVAGRYRGKYISHIRNEGPALLEAIDELVRIGREGGLPAEIYHLKAAGRSNWANMDTAIEKIEAARSAGERLTADMYTYPAASTGLASCIPPWFHEGGADRLYERLDDRVVREQIREAILHSTDGWENLYEAVGGPSGILILGTRLEENRRYQGKTLTEVAAMDGVDPIDALIDLVRRDRSRISSAYFSMSEENVRKQIALPWVSFGSDARSIAAEGVFLQTSTHPRAYGNFARLLGKYVREENAITLAEAICRLSRLPADNLELDRRGRIEEGYYADLVVFDPETVGDRATYADPHQYSVGVRDVIVNGVPSLRDGGFTGALKGRALYGPGKR